VMLWADAGRAVSVGAIAVLSHTNMLPLSSLGTFSTNSHRLPFSRL
jgi:hypothetical protein